MNNAEWEMLKTSYLVRRVRAGEVPEDVREPIDWHRELNDDYDWVWYYQGASEASSWLK